MKMSLKKIANALLLTTFSGAMLLTTAHANNPPPTIKADAPNRYIVKKAIPYGISQGVISIVLGAGKRFGRPISKSKTPTLFILTTFLFYA